MHLGGLRLNRLAPNFPKIFPSLTALDLRDNELRDLPQSFLALTSLTSLQISGNPRLLLPSSLAEIRVEMAKRLQKTQAKSVTVVLAGNGSRSWLLPEDDDLSLLQKCYLTEPNFNKHLRVITSLNPLIRELNFPPRAMYLVTVNLLAPKTSDISPILRKIAAVGLRTNPPVWVVGTDVERANPTAIAQAKSVAERLMAKYSLNYVGFFTVEGRTDRFV